MQTTDSNVNEINKKVILQSKNINNLEKEVVGVNSHLSSIDNRLDQQDKHLVELDDKVLLNVPLWCKNIAPLLFKDWVLIAKRLGYSQADINAWQTQADPFMSLIQEWFTVNKSSDATIGFLKLLKDLNRKDCINIIEKCLDEAALETNQTDDVKLDFDLVNMSPQIFMSFQWEMKEKAELLKTYLEQNNRTCWLDIGQMGGSTKRNERIDKGIRAAHVLICFVTNEYAKNETCIRQVNLAVSLGKPIIPLLVEKLKWPPNGSLGPILSGYLFIRFYQRSNETTNDGRFWPADKFEELMMQLKLITPSKITVTSNQAIKKEHPLVFISYNWDKQKQIISLHNKLTSFGLTCWLDVKEMSGGDTLYEKIDEGIRNCHVVISCVTEKYSLSANCRKEVSLANSVGKPIIPLLLQPNYAYPPAGPMGPILASLPYIDFTENLDEQNSWTGVHFKELVENLKTLLP